MKTKLTKIMFIFTLVIVIFLVVKEAGNNNKNTSSESAVNYEVLMDEYKAYASNDSILHHIV